MLSNIANSELFALLTKRILTLGQLTLRNNQLDLGISARSLNYWEDLRKITEAEFFVLIP